MYEHFYEYFFNTTVLKLKRKTRAIFSRIKLKTRVRLFSYERNFFFPPKRFKNETNIIYQDANKSFDEFDLNFRRFVDIVFNIRYC